MTVLTKVEEIKIKYVKQANNNNNNNNNNNK